MAFVEYRNIALFHFFETCTSMYPWNILTQPFVQLHVESPRISALSVVISSVRK